MEKKPLSIGAQMFWGKIFIGCLWTGYAIIGMFDNLACDILSIAFLSAGAVVLVMLMRIALEDDDEMARHNYIQAKAKTTDVMHIILCVFCILSALIVAVFRKAGIEYDRLIPRAFFLLMGIQNIVTGLIFKKLEKE